MGGWPLGANRMFTMFIVVLVEYNAIHSLIVAFLE